MSKRLQVIVSDQEWQRLKQTAKRQGLTVSEWARRAIRASWRREPSGDLGSKVQAVRASATHDFPTGPIEQMLEEIELGYQGRKSSS